MWFTSKSLWIRSELVMSKTRGPYGFDANSLSHQEAKIVHLPIVSKYIENSRRSTSQQAQTCSKLSDEAAVGSKPDIHMFPENLKTHGRHPTQNIKPHSPIQIWKGWSSVHHATCWAMRWCVTCAANKGRPALASVSAWSVCLSLNFGFKMPKYQKSSKLSGSDSSSLSLSCNQVPRRPGTWSQCHFGLKLRALWLKLEHPGLQNLWAKLVNYWTRGSNSFKNPGTWNQMFMVMQPKISNLWDIYQNPELKRQPGTPHRAPATVTCGDALMSHKDTWPSSWLVASCGMLGFMVKLVTARATGQLQTPLASLWPHKIPRSNQTKSAEYEPTSRALLKGPASYDRKRLSPQAAATSQTRMEQSLVNGITSHTSRHLAMAWYGEKWRANKLPHMFWWRFQSSTKRNKSFVFRSLESYVLHPSLEPLLFFSVASPWS